MNPSTCHKCGVMRAELERLRDIVCESDAESIDSVLCSSAKTEREDSGFVLPTVAGRRIRGSNNDFERACLVHIERLQHGLGDYDSAMMDTFCEAVRLVREYSDVVQKPPNIGKLMT